VAANKGSFVSVRFHDFELDLHSGELRKAGCPSVRLPEQSFVILKVLVEHSGKVVSRAEIQKRLWPHGTIVEFEHSIGAAMNRLRQVLGDSAEEPRFIETLPRRGYRWLAEAELVADGESGSPSTGSLTTGKHLGPYRIESYIGAGGMGEVFRATDVRLHRTVALKLLPASQAVDPVSRQRFLQEARAASALDHPNIVCIHDISSHEGRDFIVMEFVEGTTLSSLIGGEGIPLTLAANIGVQIALALDAAHAVGVVHRDIKPANTMVTGKHVVKVLDFGVARMVSQPLRASETNTATQLTQEGAVVGTVSYMSPEQARGENVDRRSDIFSLGSLLYETVTGRLPFGGPTPLAVMHRIATETPPAPSSIRAGVPVAFDHLIAMCMAKNPAQRPDRAAEVAEALQALAVPPKIAATLPRDSRRIVAVVPFQFHGVAQEDRFLCSALAETIANRLSKASTLVVRPTATLMKYAGKQADWAQIAREMSVDIVVEGSIQRIGSRVRVMVQVFEDRDSRMLHSQKMDGDMADLFGLQDRLADSIFDALAPKTQYKILPTPTAAARQPLAVELYLRAVDKSLCFNKFEIAAAIEMLDRAVELDPGFADAWGMMSTVCSTMGCHFDPDPKWFSKAERAISRTLELDPLNSEAFCARGLIHFSPSRGFQLAPALRAINAALKINPGRVPARAHRAAVLFHLGFHEASLEDYDEAVLANPGLAVAYSARSLTALYMGDYEQAERWVDKAQALDPALVFTNISAPLHAIYSGDVGKAWEKLRLARNMIPDEPQIAATEALILAHEGKSKRAEELADEAVSSKRSVLHSHHAWHCAAGAYAICGLADKAIHELRRCAENGLPNHRAFEADPHFRLLLGHPEFVALMRDIRRGYELLREEFGLSEVYVPSHAKGR
jgi:eukaryotic-like serine/threonine-protein kinase